MYSPCILSFRYPGILHISTVKIFRFLFSHTNMSERRFKYCSLRNVKSYLERLQVSYYCEFFGTSAGESWPLFTGYFYVASLNIPQERFFAQHVCTKIQLYKQKSAHFNSQTSGVAFVYTRCTRNIQLHKILRSYDRQTFDCLKIDKPRQYNG